MKHLDYLTAVRIAVALIARGEAVPFSNASRITRPTMYSRIRSELSRS
jgi:hypothetical protein